MPVTQPIYQQIKKQYPELFIEGLKPKPASTLYAEFLPNTALSTPNESPWGQYSNRELPPKAKTIIISYSRIDDMPWVEKIWIDKVARFLKRAGFMVLIQIDDELDYYDLHLFNHNDKLLIGNKTRAEIQKWPY